MSVAHNHSDVKRPKTAIASASQHKRTSPDSSSPSSPKRPRPSAVPATPSPADLQLFLRSDPPSLTELRSLGLQAAVGSCHIVSGIDHLLTALPQQPLPRSPQSQLELAQAFFHLVRHSSGPLVVARDWTDLHRLVESCPADSPTRWLASRALAAARGLDDVSTLALSPRPSIFSPDPLEAQPPTRLGPPLTSSGPAVNVADVLMTPGPQIVRPPLSLVQTAATVRNLFALALGLEHHPAVCVLGPRGCGKSLLIRELAQHTGHSLVSVQVDDQTDLNALVGCIACTPQPGVFQWQPGPLAVAVHHGHWVLVEDVDRAPLEVLLGLVGLLDHNELLVRSDAVPAHPRFRLILTSNAAPRPLLASKLRVVELEAQPRAELETIACASFSTVPPHIVAQIVASFVASGHEERRDLFKWLARVQACVRSLDVSRTFLTERDKEAILQQALDVLPPAAFAHVCQTWALDPPALQPQPPLVQDSTNVVAIGRARLASHGPKPTSLAYTSVALCALERLAVCVQLVEPVLLVGETGTGKTALVQHLASLCGKELVVINMHVTSDPADLIGGFKPLDLHELALALHADFVALFTSHFDAQANQAFLTTASNLLAKRNFSKLVKAWLQACRDGATRGATGAFQGFAGRVAEFEKQCSAPLFGFVEGALVRALRRGDWVLLDEINLASHETLDRIAPLLDGPRGSLCLTERGDTSEVPRHAEFRFFACMNPANDVGKKALAPSLASRLTHIEVGEAWLDSDLALVAQGYLEDGRDKTGPVVDFFKRARELAQSKALVDSAGLAPRYSLRTLVRALESARRLVSVMGMGLQRALHEGFQAMCLTSLATESRRVLKAELDRFFPCGGPLPACKPKPECVIVGGYRLPRGPLDLVEDDDDKGERFCLTPSVAANVEAVARAVVLAKYPILLQGPTSAGKTSLVHFLARKTGHVFVRINNHEHTDLNEYTGSYASDPVTGALTFQPGVLVQALKLGHWVVLDELNLAPSEVLEALNRLLDDNRELFVPETGETVKPHKDFCLFATQNPPGGSYGGRKQLSRAFRNRFMEIHVDDIPPPELEQILGVRSQLPKQFCAAMVNAMKELQLLRSSSSLFAGKAGLITPRDLLRWADRHPASYDELASHGFCLLGERLRTTPRRSDTERAQVAAVLERQTRGKVSLLSRRASGGDDLVWTSAMSRLYGLVSAACDKGEAVLLVGETGGGKTSCVQALARERGKRLVVVNLHANTEAADLLGSTRPSRARPALLRAREEAGGEERARIEEQLQRAPLFEWVDGPLVACMRSGDYLLLDELSLADDAVLERLNSVLDRARTVLLSERGGAHAETVTAHPDFRLLATMNPGGDFGKRELSPALRNRFTEIWLPPVSSREDVLMLCTHLLRGPHERAAAASMADFFLWFNAEAAKARLAPLSSRDLVAWTDFIKLAKLPNPDAAFAHGAYLVVLDGLGRDHPLALEAQARLPALRDEPPSFGGRPPNLWGCAPFFLETGPLAPQPQPESFAFDAPTTARNLMRVLRGMVLRKAVLLEGSPGVGKTGLISALARVARWPLVRLNLSEHTDFADLVGSDLPAPGGGFAWADGALLQAVKQGHWVLLDELNLASQSVLEGLNALLDHRACVFIPELGIEVPCAKGFRLFAAQNPVEQGGGRKGLPRSFLNRFTRVRVDALGTADMLCIVNKAFAGLAEAPQLLEVNRAVAAVLPEVEANLRDVHRLCELHVSGCAPGDAFDLVYAARLGLDDRAKLARAVRPWLSPARPLLVSADECAIAEVRLKRRRATRADRHGLQRLATRAWKPLEHLARCVGMGWPALVCGPPGSGKVGSKERGWPSNAIFNQQLTRQTFLVEHLAAACGRKLTTLYLCSATDLADLVGGFAQRVERDDFEEEEEDALARTSRLARLLEPASTRPGAFEWVDGPLLRAMRLGHWLVLDNCNTCSPSVLDRLNSLLEPRGVLVLTERGGDCRPLVPHPDFRIFLLCDPALGAVSRALRNRCCHISLGSALSPRDAAHAAFDCLARPSYVRAAAMARMHLATEWRGNLAHLARFAHVFSVLELVAPARDCLRLAFRFVYRDDVGATPESKIDAFVALDAAIAPPASPFCLDWQRLDALREHRLAKYLAVHAADALVPALCAAAVPDKGRFALPDLLGALGQDEDLALSPSELYVGLVGRGLVAGQTLDGLVWSVLDKGEGVLGRSARGEGESAAEVFCLAAVKALWQEEQEDKPEALHDFIRQALMLPASDAGVQLAWLRAVRAVRQRALLSSPAVVQLDRGMPQPVLELVARLPACAVDDSQPRPPRTARLAAAMARLDALAPPPTAERRRELAQAWATLRWASAGGEEELGLRAAEAVALREERSQPPSSPDPSSLARWVYGQLQACVLVHALQAGALAADANARLLRLAFASGCASCGEVAPHMELAWSGTVEPRLVVELSAWHCEHALKTESLRACVERLRARTGPLSGWRGRRSALEQALGALAELGECADALEEAWRAVRARFGGGAEALAAWAQTLSPLDARAEAGAALTACEQRLVLASGRTEAGRLWRRLELGEEDEAEAEDSARWRAEADHLRSLVSAPRRDEYRSALRELGAVLAWPRPWQPANALAALDRFRDRLVCDINARARVGLCLELQPAWTGRGASLCALDGRRGFEGAEWAGQALGWCAARPGAAREGLGAGLRARVQSWREKKDREDAEREERERTVVFESRTTVDEERDYGRLFPSYHAEFEGAGQEAPGEPNGGNADDDDGIDDLVEDFVALFGQQHAGARDEWRVFERAWKAGAAADVAGCMAVLAHSLKEMQG